MGIGKSIDISSLAPLYPFRSHYLSIDGLNCHYLDEGRGDPVVMLHGNPTWSFYYRALVCALRNDYRVVVPDHIGCGLSDKPPAHAYGYRLQNRVNDLAQLIAHLHITDRLTLVLHDWGGMIGIVYALRHPERIGRMVVMNTAGFLPIAGKRLPWQLRIIRAGGVVGALLVQGLNAFALGASRMASRQGLSRPVRRGLLAPYNCWPNRIATLKFVQDIPMAPADPSFETVAHADRHLDRLSGRPILICWGLRDFVFDGDYLAEWRRRFPGAEVHRFAEAGHYVLEDVPREIVPLVQDFLGRHPLPK